MVTCADAAGGAASRSRMPPSVARCSRFSRTTGRHLWSERLEILCDVDRLLQRSGLDREVDEFLVVRLVPGREVLGHEVADHWHRIDDIVGRERVLEQMLACFLRIGVDEFDRLAPGRGEAFGDIRSALAEVAGERSAAD